MNQDHEVEICHLQHMNDEAQPEKFWWEARKITSEGEMVIGKCEYTVGESEKKGSKEKEEQRSKQLYRSIDAHANVVGKLIYEGWKIAETNEQSYVVMMNRDERWMKQSTRIQKQIAVIEMEGAFNFINIWPWIECLKLTIDNDVTSIIVDMTGVRSMNSGGLKVFFRFILSNMKKAEARILIACVPPFLEQTLQWSGLDEIITRYGSVEEAVNALEYIEKSDSMFWVDTRYVKKK